MTNLRLPRYYRGMIQAGCSANHLRQLAESQAARNRESIRKSSNEREHRKRASSDGTMTAAVWGQMVEYCNDQCLGCGSPGVTKDHIVPVSMGGQHTASNIQPLCGGCNAWKGTKTVDYRPGDWPWRAQQ